MTETAIPPVQVTGRARRDLVGCPSDLGSSPGQTESQNHESLDPPPAPKASSQIPIAHPRARSGATEIWSIMKMVGSRLALATLSKRGHPLMLTFRTPVRPLGTSVDECEADRPPVRVTYEAEKHISPESPDPHIPRPRGNVTAPKTGVTAPKRRVPFVPIPAIPLPPGRVARRAQNEVVGHAPLARTPCPPIQTLTESPDQTPRSPGKFSFESFSANGLRTLFAKLLAMAAIVPGHANCVLSMPRGRQCWCAPFGTCRRRASPHPRRVFELSSAGELASTASPTMGDPD